MGGSEAPGDWAPRVRGPYVVERGAAARRVLCPRDKMEVAALEGGSLGFLHLRAKHPKMSSLPGLEPRWKPKLCQRLGCCCCSSGERGGFEQ